MEEELIYQIALSLIPGIGTMHAKELLAHTGSAGAVFKESEKSLRTISGIGTILARNIKSSPPLERASKEFAFLQKSGVRALFYLDADYPKRLLGCVDAPIVLYVKGEPNLNRAKVISVVGTRHATEYGRSLVEKLIGDLAERGYSLLVVSGLAYGIDIQAHKSALRFHLPTVAVLGHGLETVYPALHTSITREMIEKEGGLVSDFLSYTPLDRNNFLRRNRIIAGLADATIVVESARKGGALLTADLANSYNRDLFAYPGRVGDTFSEGCHFLIKSNRAALIEGIHDLEYAMNWSPQQSVADAVQPTLFYDLSPEESAIVSQLRSEGPQAIDLICIKTAMPMCKVSPTLLNLEFAGIVKGLPGKVFKLI